MQPFGDNVVSFKGSESVSAYDLSVSEQSAAGEPVRNEPDGDRLRFLTRKLRAWHLSEDSILAVKVAVTMAGVCALAYPAAIALEALGIARYLFP